MSLYLHGSGCETDCICCVCWTVSVLEFTLGSGEEVELEELFDFAELNESLLVVIHVSLMVVVSLTTLSMVLVSACRFI